MNYALESLLHHLSIVLNGDMTMEDGYAWIVPTEYPELLLTLVWEEESNELIYSLSLGTFNDHLPKKLALDCLQTNLLMAAKGGPKLTYSSDGNMITLIDNVNVVNTSEESLGYFTLEFIKFGAEIRNKIGTFGYKIDISMGN